MTSHENRKELTGWPWTEKVDASLYDTSIQWPKISVVTPSFNQGPFLEETILSVLNQNYPNIEYFIIDGGSTDHTVSIIQKYESNITYWVSESDNGQTHALNKGLSKATGEILFWINSDDYFESGAFHTVVSAFLKDPSAKVVCARSIIIGDKAPQITHTILTNDPLERVITINRFQQQPTIFKLDFIKSIGLLDETYHFIMDLELWINYVSQFGMTRIIEISDVIAAFRMHDVSKSVSKATMFERERDELYIGLIEKENPLLYDQLQKLMHFHTRSVDRIIDRIREHTRMNLHTIVQYYLLLRTMEAYETGNKSFALKLSNLIEKDVLQSDDQLLLYKLKWKIRLIPYVVKKMIQKIRL